MKNSNLKYMEKIINVATHKTVLDLRNIGIVQ